MTARQQRRQEERKARKAALKSQKTSEGSTTTTAADRAEVNRNNAQYSTGPRTAEGKAASSQNAFKHGLYSRQLILPGEDPAELDALRADLRREHQPGNTTEDILVNELAEHYWRLRRMRKLEARAMGAGSLDDVQKGLAILPIIQRTMASAERGFHKALKALNDLQRQRGFVPQPAGKPAEEIPQITVPAECKEPLAAARGAFVSQNSLEAADLAPVDLCEVPYVNAA